MRNGIMTFRSWVRKLAFSAAFSRAIPLLSDVQGLLCSSSRLWYFEYVIPRITFELGSKDEAFSKVLHDLLGYLGSCEL